LLFNFVSEIPSVRSKKISSCIWYWSIVDWWSVFEKSHTKFK